MTDKYERRWTLTDYQQFLQHPAPIIRNWAVNCIKEQYPLQAADSFVDLLTDDDSHLQIVAARAIGDSGDPRFEPALLVVWPDSQGFVRNWLIRALGQLRSKAILPELLAELETVPSQPLTGEGELRWLPAHSVAEALGHYPDASARQALWQLVERYPVEDRLTFNAVEGLLRFIRPAEFSRLVRRWEALKPGGDHQVWRIARTLARAANLEGLAEQLLEPLAVGMDEALAYLDFWFLEAVPYSDRFLDALEQVAEHEKAGIFGSLLAELERVMAARGHNLTGWPEDDRPTGYRWRMLYAYQLLSSLAAHPPSQPEQFQEAAALGLALLAQALVDQDDETALQAAPNEMFRQATLLSLMGSNRPNVLPDIVDQVAALGPEAVPHLLEVLEEDKIWAWLRALPALERIARAHPGTADGAVPAILDLVHLEQSDEILEAASAVLIAIGPGAVEAIGERLGQDYVYDIYAGGALAQIPTEGSAEAWLDYLSLKPAVEEFDLEALGNLGHEMAVPFLRDNFAWRDDPMLCTVLYKLAEVTDYRGPELRHWRRVAVQDYQAYVQSRDSGRSGHSTTGQE